MKKNSNLLRTLSALAVVALVCIGLAFHTGMGTPSAWGLYNIASICPLGAVEAALASKTILPPLMIAVVVTLLLLAAFGRIFCAWGCPIPLLRRIFGLKPSKAAPKSRFLDVANNERGSLADSRNWVLGGTLLSTALFGFPVFCLICPVGLTFATIIAFWHLLQFSEVVLSLVVFPVILIVEVLVLRTWCSRFCPLGALLSLAARLNKTFRPKSAPEACLQSTKDESCRRCADVCPEGINLHDSATSAPLNECTKCRACADVCPMQAISFPLFSKSMHKKKDKTDSN